MSVATSTAIIIGAGAAAGTSIYGAHKAASAAKDAAKQQQAGVREARAYGEPLYQQALQIAKEQAGQGQALLAPYAQQGSQGLYALSDFLGVPRAPATAAPVGQFARGERITPPAPVAASPGGPMPSPGAPATVGTMPGAPATQSSYVTLRAPNGQTQPVPAEHADYYLARGATRV